MCNFISQNATSLTFQNFFKKLLDICLPNSYMMFWAFNFVLFVPEKAVKFSSQPGLSDFVCFFSKVFLKGIPFMIMPDSFSFFFILPTKLFIMSYFKTFPFLKTTKRRGLIFDSNQHFSCSKSTSTDFCSHFQFSEKFSNFVVVLFTK